MSGLMKRRAGRLKYQRENSDKGKTVKARNGAGFPLRPLALYVPLRFSKKSFIRAKKPAASG